MKKVTKTVRTHFAQKLADSRIYCNVGTDHNPSGEDWIKCYLHLITAWVDKQRELPKMSSEEITAYLVNLRLEIDKVHAFLNIDFAGLLDTGLISENKNQEEKCNCEMNFPNACPFVERLPKREVKKIIIKGKKSDFGKNAVYFFFHPFNPNGIHLSNIYAGTIIDMLIERFEAFDGSPFSHRSLMDNIALGRNRN